MATQSRPLLSQLSFFVATAGLIVAAALAGDALRLAWRFDRAAIAAGEWWRLASGHFVHLGWAHTMLNLLGLALAAALFAPARRPHEWAFIAFMALATISAWLYWLRPDLGWYVGYSGILHGLFAAGALGWIAAREAEGWLLAGFLVGKLFWEQRYGALPLSVSAAGGPVVIDAHLAGAVGGLAASLPIALRDWAEARR